MRRNRELVEARASSSHSPVDFGPEPSAGKCYVYDYVRQGQTKIEDVKSLIGKFALRNASNPLELRVSDPQGSWQKVEIKDPGFDAPDGLILWLQVGEALSFN